MIVEVFIQDWKSYEGWEKLAKHTGKEGSEKGLILSLLCDHVLLVHQAQGVLFKNNEPAATVGSLRDKVIIESIINFISEIVISEDPQSSLKLFSEKVVEFFDLRSSEKHLRHIDMDDIGEAA